MNRKGIQRHPTAATHRSNAKASSGSLVCLFIAKVCITVLLCVTAHAEGDFSVNAGGGLRFFELRSVDGAEVIHKRALSQILGVTFTHQRPRGAHFLVVTRLNLSTDLGIDDALAQRLDDPSSLFVSEQLELAFLRVAMLEGRASLTAGRMTVIDPAGALFLDGLQGELRLPDGVFISGHAGSRVLPGRPLSRGDIPFGASWAGVGAPLYDDVILSFGAVIGHSGRRLRTSFAARRELSISDSPGLQPPAQLPPHTLTGEVLTDDRVAAAAHLTPSRRLELSADANYHLGQRRLESARVEAVTHLDWKSLALGLRLESDTPLFPTGSAMSAFAVSPIGTLTTFGGADVQIGESLARLDTRVGVRSYAANTEDLTIPLFSQRDEHVGHGLISARWSRSFPERKWFSGFDLHTSLRLEDGSVGSLLVAQAGARVQLLRKQSWVRLRGSTTTSRRADLPHLQGTSAAAHLGAGAIFPGRGRVEGTVEYTSNAYLLHALAFFMNYRFDHTLLDGAHPY